MQFLLSRQSWGDTNASFILESLLEILCGIEIDAKRNQILISNDSQELCGVLGMYVQCRISFG